MCRSVSVHVSLSLHMYSQPSAPFSEARELGSSIWSADTGARCEALGKQTPDYTARSCRLCQPEAKAQTIAEAAAPTPAPIPSQAS